MRSLVLLFSISSMVVSGCTPACTLPIFIPGVVVTVLNAQTNEPVTDATVTLTGGSVVAVLPGAGGRFSGGYAGTFTITVQAAGFESQSVENVVVEQAPDGCGPLTEYVEVRLTPLSN